ncbi:MAG: cyclohexanecarboxylate-CoA ligase, partial [Frankiales bacterium]|nr:cyclohexanecarboxylate-CoA ligase [Frankiales bacterium]
MLEGNGTLWELVEQRAALGPDLPYLIDEDDRSLTFGQFRDQAERVAAGLHARGIAPGDCVTWVLPTWIESVVLSVALARLGAVQNPIIPIYGRREVEALVRQSAARLLVVPPEWRGTDFAALAQELAADLGDLNGGLDVLVLSPDGLPEGDPATLPPPPVDPDAVRWLYSTSGTTSGPKCVKHSDATLIAAGRGTVPRYELVASDVSCIPFPYAHIGGPDMLTMSLLVGSRVLLLATFVPDVAVALHVKHGVTQSGSSTAFYQAFLNEQRKTPDRPVMPDLRLLAGGGAPMPSEIYWAVKKEMGVTVAQGYGMTEVPMITTGGPGDSDDQLAYSEGAPIDGIEVSLRNEWGEVVPAGEPGEVWVRGPMVCLGYVDEQATAESFDAAGFFRTGDVGRFREDGHLRLTGRMKDIIIRKGENISPQEVEEVLQTHPAIGAVAVLGLPDEERGERVCAVVELVPGQPAPTLPDLLAHCVAAGLSKRKAPEQLEVVPA